MIGSNELTKPEYVNQPARHREIKPEQLVLPVSPQRNLERGRAARINQWLFHNRCCCVGQNGRRPLAGGYNECC